ncbi:hypothetical protein [Burkholderia thailandensis]|uniref:hypothetical protein n=1 Tax=Burkholderia thailandensis TaxID=57975 RepID=UPI001E523647|nr:hypothetical protein [Burkholderia thailandensis]
MFSGKQEKEDFIDSHERIEIGGGASANRPDAAPPEVYGLRRPLRSLSGIRRGPARRPRVILSQPDHGVEPGPPRQIAAITHR